MFCAADHPFLHLEKHQQTSPLSSTIARVEKYNIVSAHINLVFSAENEGLSNARQVVLHTVRGPTCIELVFY